MDTVRMHLQLDDVELGFEGSLRLYEATIEPLLVAACAAAPRAPTLEVEDATVDRQSSPQAQTQADAAQAAQAASDRSEGLTRTETAAHDRPAAAGSASTSSGDVASDRVASDRVASDRGDAKLPAAEVFRPVAPARFHQFVAQVGEAAATDEQRVMAFGFYLWNYEKRNVFNARDVRGFLAALHLAIPEDMPGLLLGLRDRKRFLEAAGEDQYALSTKGVNYVKNRLLA